MSDDYGEIRNEKSMIKGTVILSLFPFERIKRAIVHWQIKHLSVHEQEGCLGRLASGGYRFAAAIRT